MPPPGYEIILNTGGMSERPPPASSSPATPAIQAAAPGLPAEVRAKLSELTLPAIQLSLTLCTVPIHG
jgi:hypothetical protein